MARIELELPPGWQVQASKDINLSGPFGTLRRTVRQEGRVLRIKQETRGGAGMLPPSALDDLIKWLRDLGTAARDGRNLVVMRNAGSGD